MTGRGGSQADSATDELITTWELVVEGFRATSRALQEDLQGDLDLPATSVEVLLRLLRTPGHRLTMSALAGQGVMTSGGFTRVADRLESAGLIRRQPCGQDRRAVWIVLTGPGTTLAERARQVHAAHLRERVLAPLGPDRATALADTMRTLGDTARGKRATVRAGDELESGTQESVGAAR